MNLQIFRSLFGERISETAWVAGDGPHAAVQVTLEVEWFEEMLRSLS